MNAPTQWPQSMNIGTLLVAPGTSLPADWQRDDKPGVSGWSRISNHFDALDLERDLKATGWNFFFSAGSITTTASGWNKPRMLDAVLARLIAGVKLRKCNCVEIDAVGMRSFMGVPYVSLTAHPRHIQRGTVCGGERLA